MSKHLDECKIALSRPIRLALFDIDGTLLDQHGHYSDELVNQIKRVRELGVKTAIASGRPYFAARFLQEELHLNDVGVFCTGAHIYDPLAKKTLQAAYLPHSVVSDLLQELRQSEIYYELYAEHEYFYETPFAETIRESHAYHLRSKPNCADLLEISKQQPTVKFLLGAPGDDGLARLKAIEHKFYGLFFAYAKFPAHPDWHFVSVISGEACKKKAFDWLLRYYSVEAEEVASFGDSHSDMTFLSLAGHGVAMGNAADDVKAVARWVTKPAWENGVAYALSRLV